MGMNICSGGKSVAVGTEKLEILEDAKSMNPIRRAIWSDLRCPLHNPEDLSPSCGVSHLQRDDASHEMLIRHDDESKRI